MNKSKIRTITLHPGDFSFGEAGTHIQTILGSCVAITLWHPQLKIGAMCHVMMPHRPFDAMVNGKDHFCGKYAKGAFELFEMGVKLHSLKLTDFQAKIFGGADVAGTGQENGIGAQNITQCMGWVALNRIPLITAHIGESGSRKIVFDCETGEVWVTHTPANKFHGVSGKT